MSNLIYIDNTHQEVGETHLLHNVTVKDKIITGRNTLVEMIERPRWGISCYMNNEIQSCEWDERIYHESLVHPVMCSVAQPKRVMIMGGGEGATAREVLKWPVEQVDMYEWDKDVVDLFKEKYPQWAQGAWEDERLHIYTDDIFEVIIHPPARRYDVIIIDLFDPCEENKGQWIHLFQSLHEWLEAEGALVIYTGIRSPFDRHQKYRMMMNYMASSEKTNTPANMLLHHRKCTPYKVFIPSFSGESTFLLLKHEDIPITYSIIENEIVESHLSEDIWKSYKVFSG
jgi:spermidine synthase